MYLGPEIAEWASCPVIWFEPFDTRYYKISWPVESHRPRGFQSFMCGFEEQVIIYFLNVLKLKENKQNAVYANTYTWVDNVYIVPFYSL